MEILFYSTNRSAPEVNIRDAILIGQAPDKGLYMPKIIPKISESELNSLRSMNYSEIAQLITSKMLGDFVPKQILKQICDDAYNFNVPIERVFDNNYIMRLDGGPTASFKDFAARMMARLMNYFLEQQKKQLLILTATSGDTGGAVADAFYGQKNVKVIVLYPRTEISDRQRKQMTTLGGNITAIGIEGKFDDCQRMVKQAFSDPELVKLNLSSANSINFARLLPQTVYYFYAYAKLTQDNNQKVIFSVPSGNFGDLMGGVFAYKMGLPVMKFIAAVNENDEFPRFLDTGKYTKIEPSKNCLSNAMNVGHPSNLARLIDLYGGLLDETGNLKKMPDMNCLKQDIASVSINDQETRKTINNAYKKYKLVLEPHGAVGWAGLLWYLDNQFKKDIKNKNLSQIVKNYSFKINEVTSIALETADPSKFPEIIREVINVDPPMPKHLADAQIKPETIINLPVDYDKFKKFLLAN